MAHYTVTFSCGHTADVELFGHASDRERKIKYFQESGLCPDCYRRKQDEEKQAQIEATSKEASDLGLSKLTGTEKQVAWADKVRVSLIKDAVDFRAKCNDSLQHASGDRVAMLHTAIDCCDAISQIVGTETSASRIIDWRDFIWKSYTLYLLNTLPKELRSHYVQIFRTSAKFWRDTGGGFSEDVIQDIENHGYKIKINGVSNFSKDGKQRIVFDQEIPDDTDDVESTKDIPSWKRMCYCILKNDYLCRFMGFGPTKVEAQRIKAIKDKYAAIARPGRRNDG